MKYKDLDIGAEFYCLVDGEFMRYIKTEECDSDNAWINCVNANTGRFGWVDHNENVSEKWGLYGSEFYIGGK